MNSSIPPPREDLTASVNRQYVKVLRGNDITDRLANEVVHIYYLRRHTEAEEHAKLLRGFMRRHYIDTYEGTSVKDEIELVYEGLDSGKLFIIRPKSLDRITPGAKIPAEEDERYMLFGGFLGSRTVYKKFLQELKDEDYAKVMEKINQLFSENAQRIGYGNPLIKMVYRDLRVMARLKARLKNWLIGQYIKQTNI